MDFGENIFLLYKMIRIIDMVKLIYSVSLASHNPLVVGGSLPSLPTLPAPPGSPRQWGSVSCSPVGSWIFFYRGDLSLEDPEDEGWHLELFSFLFGPHLLILSKEQGHRPVPTVHLSQWRQLDSCINHAKIPLIGCCLGLYQTTQAQLLEALGGLHTNTVMQIT